MDRNAATQVIDLETLLPPNLAKNSARFIQIRWLTGSMILLATAICVRLLALPLSEGPLYLLGLFVLAYNLSLVWLTRRVFTPDATQYLSSIRRLVILQITLDWLSIAVFLHLTGGITSPGIVFFFVHVLMVSILLPGQSPYRFAALAVGVLTLIAVLEAERALPHFTVIPGLPVDLHTNPVYVLAQVIFFAAAVFATVSLTVSIMARLQERERQIAALFHTAQVVSSTLDLSDVLYGLVRSAAQAMNLPASSVRLLDSSGTQLPIASTYGLSDSYLRKGPVELAQSQLDREVLSGHPVIILETMTETRLQYPHKALEEGIRSLLVVPIMGHNNKPLGTMRFYAYEPEYFTKEDADFAMAIARQGATAIENALAHDELHKADQERAQFVRIVTHELRAPVTGAQSLLRVLLRNLAGELTPQQYDIISRLESRFDALMMLINDLLAFAEGKAVSDKQPLKPLSLQASLHLTMEKIAALAAEKQITLSSEIPEKRLTVCATEKGLSRIFDNLIGNAVKYTPEGGRVSICVETQLPNVTIRVSDTGIGIPANALVQVGKEFFRAPNAKQSNIIGTGLGLAIVKQHLDRYKGLMTVQSEEGVGTTFTITLPLNP